MNIIDLTQYIIYTLSSAGVLAIIGTIIGKVFTSKKTVQKITNGVTEKIVTKNIKVDLTAVTEKQFEAFRNEMAETRDLIRKQNKVLKAEGVVLAKMKMATAEEKQAIIDSINELDTDCEQKAVVEDTKSVVVKIEPVKPVETTRNESDLF